MTIESMIKILERGQRMPGTVIQRAFLIDYDGPPTYGVGWIVGVGELQQPKKFQQDRTIREALMRFPRVRRALARAAR